MKDFFSERMVFGLLLIVGYLGILALSMLAPLNAPTEARAIAHDGLLVLGPLLGTIVSAIWKSDRADKSNAAALASATSALAAVAPTIPPVADK